jgi:hypothetical protein
VQECLQKVNNLVGEQKKDVRFSSWNAVEVSCVMQCSTANSCDC